MARWQIIYLGRPTGQILTDNQTMGPMETGFSKQQAATLAASTLNISIGSYATLDLALAANGYTYSYVDEL